jgi:predicted phosphodiesterase
MKIAVLSDIHGNLAALQAVLEEVERSGADVVVNLGDILSGPLQPRETAELLMARAEIVTIAGNHERQVLELWDDPGAPRNPLDSDGYTVAQLEPRHADWLRSLPATRWLAEDVLLVHGTPGTDAVYWLESVTPGQGVHGGSGMRPASAQEIARRLATAPDAARASLVLCGHTHVPRAVRCGATLIVNPGSVGLQAYADTHPHPHRMEIGSPEARYALVERCPAGWRVEHRAVPYGWAPQAEVARSRGRPDWAAALATGRVSGLETIGA